MSTQKFIYNVEQRLNPNNYSVWGYHFVDWIRQDTSVHYTDEQSVRNLSIGNYDTYILIHLENDIPFLKEWIESARRKGTYFFKKQFNSSTYETIKANETIDNTTYEYYYKPSPEPTPNILIFNAQWAANQFLVEINYNDGNRTANKIYDCTYNVELNLGSKPTYIGYIFQGWKLEFGNVSPDYQFAKYWNELNQQYETFTPSIVANTIKFKNLTEKEYDTSIPQQKAKVKLTAQWVPITYNLKFDLGSTLSRQKWVDMGLSLESDSTILDRKTDSYTYDKTESFIDSTHFPINDWPKRIGYNLVGWKNLNTGIIYNSTNKDILNLSAVQGSNVILTAVWEKTYTIPQLTDLLFYRNNKEDSLLQVDGKFKTAQFIDTSIVNYNKDKTISTNTHIDFNYLVLTYTKTNTNNTSNTDYYCIGNHSYKGTSEIIGLNKCNSYIRYEVNQVNPVDISTPQECFGTQLAIKDNLTITGKPYKWSEFTQYDTTPFTSCFPAYGNSNYKITDEELSNFEWNSGNSIYYIQLKCFCQSYILRNGIPVVIETFDFTDSLSNVKDFISKAFYIMDISANGHEITFGGKSNDDWEIKDKIKFSIRGYLEDAIIDCGSWD